MRMWVFFLVPVISFIFWFRIKNIALGSFGIDYYHLGMTHLPEECSFQFVNYVVMKKPFNLGISQDSSSNCYILMIDIYTSCEMVF